MTLGTQTKPYGKLLDYEQFIDHQINRTRKRIKLNDIQTAVPDAHGRVPRVSCSSKSCSIT